MRTIKFRGKRGVTGKFIFGDLVRNIDGRLAIIPPFKNGMDNHCEKYEVDEDTIGQFTGLKDKNGNDIYEGDIFNLGDKNISYQVIWHDCGLNGKQIGSSSYIGLNFWLKEIEVIGNIY